MPKCDKCSSKRDMNCIKIEKVADVKQGATGNSVRTQKNAGHPIMAGIFMVLGIGASVANYFYEKRTYRCPNCKATKTITQKKN